MPGFLRWKTVKIIVFIVIVISLVGVQLTAWRRKRLEEMEMSQAHDIGYQMLKVQNEERTRVEKNNVTVDFVFNGHKFRLSQKDTVNLPQNPASHYEDQRLNSETLTTFTKTPKPMTSSRFQSLKQTSGTSFTDQYDAKKNESLHVFPHQPVSRMTSPKRHYDVNLKDNQTQPDNGSNKTRALSKLSTQGRNELNSSVEGVSRVDFEKIKFRFEERNRKIREVCNDNKHADTAHVWRGRGRVVHLARDRLSACLVPKAGTTYLQYQLKKKLKVKGRYENDFDYAHDRKRFFIVREPYGRLVSAYFSKVVSHPMWWQSLGRFIVKKMRRNPSKKSLRCGHDVTFPEFIKYFLLSQARNRYKNNHFVPIHELCNPCLEDRHSMKFDFVAHLESMKEEMLYILDSVNVTTYDNFRFDPVKNIVGHFMSSRNEHHEHCGDPWCPIFERLWWGLQSNGHISTSIPLPLKGGDCDGVNPDQMIDMALKAADQSRDIMDKTSQKREAVAKLYAQVDFEDRIRVRNALMLDFDLFGYDPQPSFVFSPDEMESITTYDMK